MNKPYTQTPLYIRRRRPNYSLLFAALVVSSILIWALNGTYHHPPRVYHHGFPSRPEFAGPVLSRQAVPCRSARGEFLPGSRDDALYPVTFTEATPQPYAGSYKDLGLEQTWLTASQRFGPYGMGEDLPDYNRSKVDWEKVDWAELQNACIERNCERFLDHGHRQDGNDGQIPTIDPGSRPVRRIDPSHKMALPSWTDHRKMHPHYRIPQKAKPVNGGRTAIVLRAWSTFEWAEENQWMVRSLITEAALASGGEYTVYILMDVKKEHTRTYPDIWSDAGFYNHLLDILVPTEFRNITVLFNRDLLERWYPAAEEHRPEYQMFQPLQLFAQSFPKFDYYFQLEMDVRFTGHAGDILSSLSTFSRNEPRKQARQRASYAFLPSIYNTYSNFTHVVDATLDHADAYYTGLRIPEVPQPIGPDSPFDDPTEDPFAWGVGEDADFITFSPCNNATVHRSWHYDDWVYNFGAGRDPPRLICSVTISRTSWNLLNAVHDAQVERGIRVQSEATMGSFALWHGAKISVPPLPMYSRLDNAVSAEEVSLFINGGAPSRAHDGMAWGELVYGTDGPQYRQNTTLQGGIGPTWRYKTEYPQELWRAWMEGSGRPEPETEMETEPEGQATPEHDLPTLLRRNGRLYLPNSMFHPIKTNGSPKNNEPPRWLRFFGVEEW